jgi:predicted amidophosphoribosyltransferase
MEKNLSNKKIYSTNEIAEDARERYKLCPGCWNFYPLTEDQIYCITCGEKLIEECSKCHTPIFYPTARFCPQCGEGYKLVG